VVVSGQFPPPGPRPGGGGASPAGLPLNLHSAGDVVIDGGGRVGGLGASLHADAEAVAQVARGAHRRSAVGPRRDVEAVDAEALSRLLENVHTACPPLEVRPRLGWREDLEMRQGTPGLLAYET